MERKIGEIFEYNGEWYQAVDNTNSIMCSGCAFVDDYNECEVDISVVGNCGCKDGNPLIFKKLEKVGEPITVNGKKVQLLKTIIANCDNCAFYKDINCDFTCYPRKCYGGEEGTYVEINEDMEENKLNLKPFDIQKAREGKPVCTRDGRKARIICFDAKFPKIGNIVTLVEKENGEEIILYYYDDGHCNMGRDYDLMMLPEKKKGWVNVYCDCDGANITKDDNIYSSKDAAIASAQMIDRDNYVATIKIQWEE